MCKSQLFLPAMVIVLQYMRSTAVRRSWYEMGRGGVLESLPSGMCGPQYEEGHEDFEWFDLAVPATVLCPRSPRPVSPRRHSWPRASQRYSPHGPAAQVEPVDPPFGLPAVETPVVIRRAGTGRPSNTCSGPPRTNRRRRRSKMQW